MSLRDYFPDRWAWLFVLGMTLFSYGSSVFMFSRWNHAYNRHVHPVFHSGRSPWVALWFGMRVEESVARFAKDSDRTLPAKRSALDTGENTRDSDTNREKAGRNPEANPGQTEVTKMQPYLTGLLGRTCL